MKQSPIATLRAIQEMEELIVQTINIVIVYSETPETYDDLVVSQVNLVRGLQFYIRILQTIKARVAEDMLELGSDPVFRKTMMGVEIVRRDEDDEEEDEYESED